MQHQLMIHHDNSSHLALVYHSAGLEDHIICAGLILYLTKAYLQIFVAVHLADVRGFKSLFRGHKSVRPLIVDSYESIDDNTLREMLGANVEILRLGRHKRDRGAQSEENQNVTYAQRFYRDANVDYDLRWSQFTILRDLDLELAAFNKANVTSPYAFVFDDPSAGIFVDTSEIPDGMHIFNPRTSPRFPSSTIFDFGMLLEKAVLIHAADGPITQLAEHLSLSAERMAIHRYASEHRYAANGCPELGAYRADWEILTFPPSTSHIGLTIVSPTHEHIVDTNSTTSLDVLFSIRAAAAVPPSCELYAAVDKHPDILLGVLTPSAAPDSACRFTFNGHWPTERENDGGAWCDMSASMPFDSFWSADLLAAGRHRGRHTLRLIAYGLYRQPGRSAQAETVFRIDSVWAGSGPGDVTDAFAVGGGEAAGGEAAEEAVGDESVEEYVVHLAAADNWGINYLAQERLYLHHEVFSRMPRRMRAVRPGYVTEFTGLRVPRHYDCGNLDAGGGSLTNYAYFTGVPSRWFPCYELQAMLLSGQRAFTPTYPVIDEEYMEAAAVYGAALSAKGRLAVVEIGARWGTWGFRAAAAAREYNRDVTGVDLLLVESDPAGCRAIRAVAESNRFVMPYANVTVLCAAADAGSVAAWAEERDVIDLMDVDIQGKEYDLLPRLGADLLRRKVRQLVIGTHEEHHTHLHQDALARAGLDSWRVVVETPFRGAAHLPGYDCLIAGRFQVAGKWSNWKNQARPECRAAAVPSPYGPFLPWDGELILTNPDLVPPPGP